QRFGDVPKSLKRAGGWPGSKIAGDDEDRGAWDGLPFVLDGITGAGDNVAKAVAAHEGELGQEAETAAEGGYGGEECSGSAQAGCAGDEITAGLEDGVDAGDDFLPVLEQVQDREPEHHVIGLGRDGHSGDVA